MSNSPTPAPAGTGTAEPLPDMTNEQADVIVALVERAIRDNRTIGHSGVTLLRTVLRYIEKHVGPRYAYAYAIADATRSLRSENTRLSDSLATLTRQLAEAQQREREATVARVLAEQEALEAQQREREALSAHSASFGALAEIAALCNLDEVDDYGAVVRAVAGRVGRPANFYDGAVPTTPDQEG